MPVPKMRGFRLAPDTIVEMQCGDGVWRPYKAILAQPLPSGGVRVTLAPQFDIASDPVIPEAKIEIIHG